MRFLGDKDFHEGTRAWGFVLGDLGELFTGGEKLEMWACEKCGHVEVFPTRHRMTYGDAAPPGTSAHAPPF